ncbi:MAG TPA: HEAT repeat domain-containing protein [Kofleriaceae bacterium]|jgi:hypothetical protein
MSYRFVRSVSLVVALMVPLAADAQPAKKKDKAAPAQVTAAATALAGADLDAAAKAAGVLGKDKSPAGLDALLDALAMGLHPKVAAAALDALAVRKKAIAFDTLVAYSEHRDPKVRAAAVGALAALDDRRVDKHILAALRDGIASVRAAAASAVASRKLRGGVEPLLALLVKGDEAAASALAPLADPEVARKVAEAIGRAPDVAVAKCLGKILVRPDFKPDSARLEVVRALGRIDAHEAIEQLTIYLASVPARPPRPSRAEAERLIEEKVGGVK